LLGEVALETALDTASVTVGLGETEASSGAGVDRSTSCRISGVGFGFGDNFATTSFFGEGFTVGLGVALGFRGRGGVPFTFGSGVRACVGAAVLEGLGIGVGVDS
jgi:hypothetical protein